MINGLIKFTGVTGSASVAPTETSWSIERISTIWVINTTTLHIYFNQVSFTNLRDSTSGYIKIVTPSNKSDELHTEITNLISTSASNYFLEEQQIITINTSMADVNSIEWIKSS
tara:strand:- start:883 stop:1224 length:342 start_codon:yes stop_codon:yes gene_type:complete